MIYKTYSFRLYIECILVIACIISLSSCNQLEIIEEENSLIVTATAYNSLAYQTKASNPNIAAWGDTLKPGMKVIAVSRDLIDSGLVHNKEVRIEGLDGVYLVKDKMNKRYTKRVDVYMGVNVKKARKWGKKKLKIYWVKENEKK